MKFVFPHFLASILGFLKLYHATLMKQCIKILETNPRIQEIKSKCTAQTCRVEYSMLLLGPIYRTFGFLLGFHDDVVCENWVLLTLEAIRNCELEYRRLSTFIQATASRKSRALLGSLPSLPSLPGTSAVLPDSGGPARGGEQTSVAHAGRPGRGAGSPRRARGGRSPRRAKGRSGRSPRRGRAGRSSPAGVGPGALPAITEEVLQVHGPDLHDELQDWNMDAPRETPQELLDNVDIDMAETGDDEEAANGHENTQLNTQQQYAAVMNLDVDEQQHELESEEIDTSWMEPFVEYVCTIMEQFNLYEDGTHEFDTKNDCVKRMPL